MKNSYSTILLFSAIVVLFSRCNNTHEQKSNASNQPHKNKYVIKGIIHGVDSDWVYWGHSNNIHINTIIDSARVHNGKFEFSGELTGMEPGRLGIKNTDDDGKRDGIGFSTPLFLDSGTLIIECSKNFVYKNNIYAHGTKVQDEYNVFKQKSDPILTAYNVVYGKKYSANKNNEKLIDSLDNLLAKYTEDLKKVIKDYVVHHPSSVVSAYIVNEFLVNSGHETLKPLYDLLSTDVKNSVYGKVLLKSLQTKARISIGTLAPNFVLPDRNNRPVSLTSFKGKWILIDFWASWCGPCRLENPNLVKTYAHFKNKGFEIVSISMDDNKKSWLSAVKKDDLSWTQLCDLKGSKSEIKTIYSITNVPMNFLLDKNGKIIAENLRGKDLQKKLLENIDH